jgi:hypothetical protein
VRTDIVHSNRVSPHQCFSGGFIFFSESFVALAAGFGSFAGSAVGTSMPLCLFLPLACFFFGKGISPALAKQERYYSKPSGNCFACQTYFPEPTPKGLWLAHCQPLPSVAFNANSVRTHRDASVFRTVRRPFSTTFRMAKNLLVCREPIGMMTFDKSQIVFFLELSRRPTKDSHLYSATGGRID